MIQVLEYSKRFYKNFKELLENLKKILKLINVVDSINYSCYLDKFNFEGFYGDLLCRDISENYYKFV